MIVIDKNVMVPMTNGVRLATDVFRLQEAPPSPVRLVRTPYGKDQMTIGGSESTFSAQSRPGTWCSPRTSAAAMTPRASSRLLRQLPRPRVARRSVPPSTMSPLGLLRHLAEVERDWRNWITSEDPLPKLYDEGDADFDGAEQTALDAVTVSGLQVSGIPGHNQRRTRAAYRSYSAPNFTVRYCSSGTIAPQRSNPAETGTATSAQNDGHSSAIPACSASSPT
jgi:hypothetical protein